MRSLVAALALTALSAAAQAPTDVRIALVIGNAACAGRNALLNPVNDAKAMGEVLRAMGFSVVELRDGSKAQMGAAIAQVQARLKGKQAIGMLYYAGHGLQLDWRNYMVPVDAKLSQAADVPAQTVELAQVIDAFKQAGNRMNIVVLDACRSNPFSGATSGKGLAQMDAPPGTFLAYATAPGNVAEDGDSASGNGLYTQHLLAELKKPTAKIEDVFKRVRLNVRKQSQGRQIPWESTSLEDDFYFNAGLQPTQKLGDAEKDKAFALEKADWDKIKDSSNVDDFYAFLQKYPSGLITQQASAALERLAKRLVIAQAGKDGVAQLSNEPKYRLGDAFEYVVKDGFSGAETSRSRSSVSKIENGLVYLENSVYTSDGGTVKNPAGYSYDPPRMDQPGDELAVGKRWQGRTIESVPDGRKVWREDSIQVVALEDVVVPAGSFKAYRLEMTSITQVGTRVKFVYWVQPGWGQSIKSIRERRLRNGGVDREVTELVSRKRGEG